MGDQLEPQVSVALVVNGRLAGRAMDGESVAPGGIAAELRHGFGLAATRASLAGAPRVWLFAAVDTISALILGDALDRVAVHAEQLVATSFVHKCGLQECVAKC